jgi:tetratricopeptide (TPR) repeat protein
MAQAVRTQRTKRLRRGARGTLQGERNPHPAETPRSFRLSPRTVSLVLTILALVYAFLAGLRTVSDPDMGFHLATGRYVVQHHAVPHTDVLSYTAGGAEWLYPAFAEVLLYGVFCADGYAGLSWFCALVLLATVACFLRNRDDLENGIAAVLAILAVQSLAWRDTPRPDLFTQLFFAVFLVQLWGFHRCGAGVLDDNEAAQLRRKSLQLWILPPLMLLWVNFHPGFVAGLGLIFAYLVIEVADLIFPERRSAVLLRLQKAWPALAATVPTTLLNPYGLSIFKASLLIGGLQHSYTPSTGVVMEWQPQQVSSAVFRQALHWGNPDSGYWWLVLAALVVIALGVRLRHFGAALLMTAALYASFAHKRLQGLFSIVVVVVGSTILAQALANREDRGVKGTPKQRQLWSAALLTATGAFCLLTCARVVDLLSNRTYVEATTTTQFGPGESWWFPERAAAFVQREQLPGNIFQGYILGGYTAWRLGPGYRDFIDGRFDHLAPAVVTEEQALVSSPVDSSLWKSEADRRGINILFFSLARIFSEETPRLMSLCQSQEWRPIYMDDVSIVLLRNRPANRVWINRDAINCQSYGFSPPSHASRIDLANFYANVGYILMQLGRHSEAVEALDRAEALTPDDASIHLALADFYGAQQRIGDAVREFKSALAIQGDNEIILYTIGRFYVSHGRYAEARPILVKAAQLSPMPANDYCLLGVVDVGVRNPQQALKDFAKAEELGATYWRGREDMNPGLFAQIAEGRAEAYAELGQWQRAREFEQKAQREMHGSTDQNGTIR